MLGKDSITYVVIHCDNVEHAMKKLPNHTAHVIEYVVRWAARLEPLGDDQRQDLLMRMVSALTHQSVVIQGVTHPAGKKFPKLRGGTLDSTIKFMQKLLHLVCSNSSSNGGGGESTPSLNRCG